ncbi:MAG: hypothetical protein ACT6FE_02480 [Methanosarcinaceae archaeon]
MVEDHGENEKILFVPVRQQNAGQVRAHQNQTRWAKKGESRNWLFIKRKWQLL